MKTTFRSKILAGALLLLAATPAFATSSTTTTTTTANTPAAASTMTPEHLALAKQYVASVPVQDDIKAAVEDMSKNVNADQRVLFRAIADKSIDYNKLRAAAELATAELFTDDEIKAMTKFFSSPEGKSIRNKLPGYESRMQPVITEVLQTFIMKLQENNVVITPAAQ